MGIELNGFEAAKEMAAVSLAELAKDVPPDSIKRVLAVEVREEVQPVLRDVLTFEAVTLAPVASLVIMSARSGRN